MTSQAISGVGTKFKKIIGVSSDSSGAMFSTIAEINSITGPNMTRNTIDVTSLDSLNGYKEFIAGFRDGGEVTLNMNFTRAGYEVMKDDFESDVLQTYLIQLQDAGKTEFQFSGLVSSIGMGVPMDDKITSDVAIKVSGQVTVTS